MAQAPKFVNKTLEITTYTNEPELSDIEIWQHFSRFIVEQHLFEKTVETDPTFGKVYKYRLFLRIKENEE